MTVFDFLCHNNPENVYKIMYTNNKVLRYNSTTHRGFKKNTSDALRTIFCMSCLVCRILWALSPSFPLGCFGFMSTVNHLLPPATSSVTPINSMCSFTTSKTSHVLVKRSERQLWNVNIWLVDRLVVFHLSQSCPWQCHCCLIGAEQVGSLLSTVLTNRTRQQQLC